MHKISSASAKCVDCGQDAIISREWLERVMSPRDATVWLVALQSGVAAFYCKACNR